MTSTYRQSPQQINQVVLTKLTCCKVRDQTSRVPHWSQLNPYSSLEQASSVTEESEYSSDTKTRKRVQSRYQLRERTRTYCMVRRRSTTSTVFYRNMCSGTHSAMIIRNNNKPKPGPKSPSDDRIAAQQKITDNLDGKTPPMALTPQPQPSTKSEAEVRNLINSYPLFEHEAEPSDLDATIEYDIPKKMLLADELTPKGKLVMSKTFGIKRKLDKKKRKRNYQCPKCPQHYPNMVDFNKHFKGSHDPLQCKVCKENFSTPSALHRHCYWHNNLHYACSKCGKQFPFLSDRDNHEISHRKVKMHHCIHPGCNKSYLRKGELTAHALTHKKGCIYKCRLCNYTSPDQRNLKAHMREHSKLKRYLCPHCSQLFRYDTQLRCHLKKDHSTGNTRPTGNSSPEY